MDTKKKKPKLMFNNYGNIRYLMKWLGYSVDHNFKGTSYEKMIIPCAKDSIFIPLEDGKCVRVGRTLSLSVAISSRATEILSLIGGRKITEKTCEQFLSNCNSEKRIRELQC